MSILIAPSKSPKHASSRLGRRLPERRYRPELHGIRGLALLGVVLFHLFGEGRTSGGIDIFLAVTGFLFTGMLLREAAASEGHISPFKYFGRLFRRIFVPAALVGIITLVMGLLISPVTQHGQLWAEARASLLYFENFELINSQLAYGAAGPETSPFQHFWSLSVQGQFYLIWPLVAIIAVLIAKKLGTSAARAMAILAGAILIVSFAYAVYVGSYNQDEAYLMTTTRAWQLAFGALLALAGSAIRLPNYLRWPAGWIGVVLIASCGIVLDGAQLFPGPWALWPLVGLTLVFISAGPNGGDNDSTWSATYFLSNRPLAWIGDHAYGIYLWHWPLLIFYLEVRGREAIGYRGALVILAATVILAMLMYRYVEQPLQRVTKRGSSEGNGAMNKMTVAVGVGLIAVLGVTTTVLAPKPANIDAGYEGLDESRYPGAAQYFESEPAPDVAPFPDIEQIDEYVADYTKRGCSQAHGKGAGRDEVAVCEDENAPENPTATIVLAGGSHAGHLEGAFRNLGQKYGWEFLVVTKSRCDFGIEEILEDSWCDVWSENLITWLNDNDVDLVVTPGTRLDEQEYILDRAPMWWDRISETNTDLMLVRGMPRGDDVPDCLAGGGSSQECGITKEHFAETNPLLDVEMPDDTYQVDVSRYVCPQIDNAAAENCDAIVGNIIVAYDGNHLTSAFSHTLAPAFEKEMQEEVPFLLR